MRGTSGELRLARRAEEIIISTVTIKGQGLTISDIAAIARGAAVALSRDPAVLARVNASADFIASAVADDTPIYGVTTLFGGMANQEVGKQRHVDLQRLAIWMHKSTTGPLLPVADVRAAMALRANTLMRGISGIRLSVLERFEKFLNAGATPLVHETGSIGASGDLVPLAYIAGALLGIHPDYKVNLGAETLDSHTALRRLGLSPLDPLPKEGLALVNGTSVCTGIAANCVQRATSLLSLAIGAHAMFVQALYGTRQSFEPFVHEHKPHPGQLWAASRMLEQLAGSGLVHDESAHGRGHRAGQLIQDRYSVRCLPQFLGPVVDGLAQIRSQIETEANSATDNPLIDAARGTIYHCGNFLAQYIGVAMDQLRIFIGLTAKHLDAQVALLMTPEFSNGLPPSLVGNTDDPLNLGLKSLQIVGNSIMPLLCFYGNSLADRFPTHAEQFNQNINSQAMGSANLARQSLDQFAHYVANILIIAVQAVDLRTKLVANHFDARKTLSPASAPLYEAVKAACGRTADPARPLVWNDFDQHLEAFVVPVLEAIRTGALNVEPIAAIEASLGRHAGQA